ncbi:DUF6545 domain-containing protein [Nonomuraea ceibae]|uniref:DUF6545 domain-containing protein n=1 Tax=Nonomuraea ceibae TaxID=1935170 RepID=UPI001FEBE878|nr:DUF6545 domain-containing protein [Nonomuraea ceibae]
MLSTLGMLAGVINRAHVMTINAVTLLDPATALREIPVLGQVTLLLCIVGITLGTSIPAYRMGVAKLRDRTALRELQPLWDTLTAHYPDLPLPMEANLRARVLRRVLEIRDCMLSLTSIIEPQPSDNPAEVARWVAQALDAASRGRPAGTPSGQIPGPDFAGDMHKRQRGCDRLRRSSNSSTARRSPRASDHGRVRPDVDRDQPAPGGERGHVRVGRVGWGALAAGLCGGIPAVVIFGGVRKGWFGDWHIGERSQRPKLVAVIVALVVLALALLVVLGAPRVMVACVTIMLATLAVIGPIPALEDLVPHRRGGRVGGDARVGAADARRGARDRRRGRGADRVGPRRAARPHARPGARGHRRRSSCYGGHAGADAVATL